MSPENRKALQTELARGMQLTLANAEKLFDEGQFLRKHSSHPLAYLCHQVSLEECCKIEVIGVWITNLFLGDDVDMEAMTETLNNHEAKHYAKVNFAGLIGREAEAKRDDLHGQSRRSSDWRQDSTRRTLQRPPRSTLTTATVCFRRRPT